MITAELRALLAAATPGLWSRDYDAVKVKGPLFFAGTEADAALIVAAVNALPALLDVVDAYDRLMAKHSNIECENVQMAIELRAARKVVWEARKFVSLGFGWRGKALEDALEAYDATVKGEAK